MMPRWLEAWLTPVCVGWILGVAFQNGWGPRLVTFCAGSYLVLRVLHGYHQARQDLQDGSP